eukprot:6140356-Alexandrium_andersonii.AAC.1
MRPTRAPSKCRATQSGAPACPPGFRSCEGARVARARCPSRCGGGVARPVGLHPIIGGLRREATLPAYPAGLVG